MFLYPVISLPANGFSGYMAMQFHNCQLMLLIVAYIHRAKRQANASGTSEGDGSMKKVKPNATKKTAGFGNFDNW